MTAIRTSGEPAGRGVFCVPSASTPGAVWDVVWIGGGTQWCGCPGFAQRGTCRHVEQVALAVELEAREAKSNTTPESRAAAAVRMQRIEEEFAL